MAFAILKMTLKQDGDQPVICFTALPNPADLKTPLLLDAKTAEEAVEQGTSLLKSLGVKTHTALGDYETVINHFPNYFIGKVGDFEDSSANFRIHTFVPIKRTE